MLAPLRQATLQTAEFWQQSKSASGKPIVLFSGGSKSEIVLRTLLEANLQPRAIYLKTVCNNWLEMQRALLFCRERELTLEIIAVDEFKSSSAAGISGTTLLNYSVTEFNETLLPLLVPQDLQPVFTGLGIQALPSSPPTKLGAVNCGIIPFFKAEIFQNALINEPLYQEWLQLRREVPFESIDYWLDYIFKANWPDFLPRTQCTLKSIISPFLRSYLEQAKIMQRHSEQRA